MNEHLSRLTSQMSLDPPASEETIEKMQAELQLTLPQDYLDFIREANGGEGFVGDSYLALYPIVELLLFNQPGAIDDFTPGLFVFGSDGGGEHFVFDMTTEGTPILQIPMIRIDRREAIPCGNSFVEFLEYLYNYKW